MKTWLKSLLTMSVMTMALWLSLPASASAEPSVWDVAAANGLQLSEETGLETLPVVPGGTYEVIFIGEYTAMSGGTSIGWYIAGNPSSTSLLFTGPDSPIMAKTFAVSPGVTAIGLYINPAWYPGLNWYSEPLFNADSADHAWVFRTQNPNEYLVGFEDLWDGGDRDYQDQIIVVRPVLQEVDIDIKPGSFPNSINLMSKGNVPVAILSDPTFDATTVDRGTVIFAGASPLSIGQTPEDVNGDGLLDVVLHFKTQDLNLQPGDTQACLTGETLIGQQFEGCDSVRIVN